MFTSEHIIVLFLLEITVIGCEYLSLCKDFGVYIRVQRIILQKCSDLNN